MEAALKNFMALPNGKKIVCLGDMAELGPETDAEHERIAKLVAAGDYASVVLVGKNFGKYVSLLPCHHFDDSAQATAWMKEQSLDAVTMLIKGSRSSRMERLLDAFGS